MIDVTDDWWVALVIAAVFGLVGGVAYELLLTRPGGRVGLIRLPRNGDRRQFVDTGFAGSLFLGAVAAVVFLLAYQPVETTTVTDEGTTITSQYSGLGLVAVSLLVGAAGSSVLGALTRGITKAAEAVKLGTILTGLEEVKKDLEAGEGEGVVVDEGDEAAPAAGAGGRAAAKLGLLTAQLDSYLDDINR